jgi:hypothetical protein
MSHIDPPWTEVTISSWNDFDQRMEKLKHGEWLFRGHSKASWGLSTSLDRLFDDSDEIIRKARKKGRTFAKRKHEELLLQSFQKSANLFLKFLPDPSKPLEWLSIMQHFGTPTRLLDVTLSPHIGTFFALEDGSEDSCVFAFNHAEIKKINETLVQYKTYKDAQIGILQTDQRYVTVFNPEYGNERLIPQRGLFLVPSQIDDAFENLLADYPQFTDNEVCIKFNLPSKLRYQGLERLRDMNITAATLFPGIDGYCRSLKFQVLETVKSQKLLD